MKKIFQTCLLIVCLSAVAKIGFPQVISNHFFGENAWMPDTIGNANGCIDPPCVLNGKLYQQWENIKNSKASIIRFGGIAADKNMPTNYQYIRMIDAIRSNGMEPIIQVPFYNYRYTAKQAADIVYYINVTKGRNVKYWVIGNEPDLSYSFTSASQVANYFKPFASAMKNVDPSIKIIGPEVAWFNKGIIDGLTTPNGPDDITGKDQAGRYYLDIISFHTYPFKGTQSRDQVISELTSAGSLQDNLIYLNAKVAACNTSHNRTGASALKTAVTEANINWNNPPSDNLSGVGANSFIGGQFVAEMMGIGMKYGVEFINIWSVVEGNTQDNNIGYIDPATGNKKPSYHHFKLLADNFKGVYADGKTNQPNIKSFGSKDGQQVSVLILNQDMVKTHAFTLRLNTNDINKVNPLKININAGIAAEYSDVIPCQSSVLLTFNLAGTIIKKQEYSLTGHAMANLAPALTQFNTTGVTSNVGVDESSFEINTFPNPSLGKFTVQLNHENSKENKFEIQLINLIGQVVYQKEAVFLKGKEDVQLNGSFANGAYIVRVKKEGEEDVKKQIIKTQKILLQK